MNQRIFLSPPHMSGRELDYVREAFESNYIAPIGPMVDSFEKAFSEYIGIKHTVALASGTAAMHLAMRILGVGPGDEVLASTLTFIGSVTPIMFQGARPVFIDADEATWNMDPDLLEEELAKCARHGRLPKAVVPTDLYGQCANMDRILGVCAQYGVPVIADSAEALGAYYNEKHAGVGATAAVYSFNGNKIITTSGGGMLASDDKAFIDCARFLSQQAKEVASHYEHTTIGYNYRMSNILAAIGLGQLETLNARVSKRREIFQYYKSGLNDIPGITFMPEAEYSRSNRWLTVVSIDPMLFGYDSEEIRKALEEKNIESRPVWKPMHMQPAFLVDFEMDRIHANPTVNGGRYPARTVGGYVAERLFMNGLCLPSGTAMTNNDIDRVIDTIRNLNLSGIKRSA